MSKTSEQYIMHSISYSRSGLSYQSNTPKQYADRQKQYMANQTKDFVSQRAYLSDDFVHAEVQGITDDFYSYVKTSIHLSDVSSSSSSTKKTDEVKEILFSEKKISYVPIGAKINTMGSTWLVINPSNLSSVNVSAVIVRCNASYNSYDPYGNVVTEPVYVEKASMIGNDNDTKQNLVLVDGYFNITCQLNENTKKLGQNQRIILGTKPYHITGFTDFVQEFTGDRDSVHLITFTARIEEPTVNDDVTDKFIANGKSYSFSALISPFGDIAVGARRTLIAYFMVNGEKFEESEAAPVAWIWSSSDETVASVDSNGMVTANTVGMAQLTAKLAQNETIEASVDIWVKDVENASYVEFLGLPSTVVKQFNAETFTAAYFEKGGQTNAPVAWSFSGASEEDYSVVEDGNAIIVSCDSPSAQELIITATCNGVSKSLSVKLEGY